MILYLLVRRTGIYYSCSSTRTILRLSSTDRTRHGQDKTTQQTPLPTTTTYLVLYYIPGALLRGVLYQVHVIFVSHVLLVLARRIVDSRLRAVQAASRVRFVMLCACMVA